MTEQKILPNIQDLADEIMKDEHPYELLAVFTTVLQAVLPRYREAGADSVLMDAKEGMDML